MGLNSGWFTKSGWEPYFQSFMSFNVGIIDQCVNEEDKCVCQGKLNLENQSSGSVL